MRNRDRVKMVALKTKSSILMESYRQLRNKVNTMNIELKKQYFSNKISVSTGNVKNMELLCSFSLLISNVVLWSCNYIRNIFFFLLILSIFVSF